MPWALLWYHLVFSYAIGQCIYAYCSLSIISGGGIAYDTFQTIEWHGYWHICVYMKLGNHVAQTQSKRFEFKRHLCAEYMCFNPHEHQYVRMCFNPSKPDKYLYMISHVCLPTLPGQHMKIKLIGEVYIHKHSRISGYNVRNKYY